MSQEPGVQRCESSTIKRCGDFDEDCAKVENHRRCFEGRIHWWPNGSVSYLPMVDGVCPYLESEVRL